VESLAIVVIIVLFCCYALGMGLGVLVGCLTRKHKKYKRVLSVLSCSLAICFCPQEIVNTACKTSMMSGFLVAGLITALTVNHEEKK